MHSYLHIIPYAYNGGTEKDCYYIINADRKHHHTVMVLDKPGPMSSRWETLGVNVIHLDILKYSLLKFGASLRHYIDSNNYAGVYYWSYIRLPLVRYAVKNQQCKMAVHIGNPLIKRNITIVKHKVLDLFFRSNIPTRLFPCSKHVANSLKNDPYMAGFDAKVSLNPVNIPKYNPYKSKNLTYQSEVHLGMVARLDPIKDHHTVIEAFWEVQKKFTNAVLHLVGDGILRERLMGKVKKSNIHEKVVFHGNRNDVYKFLATLDLFVYATTSKEGLGNSVSEALANGLPCVLSDLPMLREIAGNSKCALFCEPGNAKDMALKIEALIMDHSMRQHFSISGYERAKSAFSAERYLRDRKEYLNS